MFKRLFKAALVFGAAALAPPLAAQTALCLPREALVASLEAQYSETLAGGGLQSGTRLIELWRSKDSGTFTILLTRPDGISCVVATGQHWHDELPAAEGVTG